MNQSGENAIANAAQGLTIYNTEIDNIAGYNGYRYFDGSNWATLLGQKSNGEISLGNTTSNYFNAPANSNYQFQIDGTKALEIIGGTNCLTLEGNKISGYDGGVFNHFEVSIGDYIHFQDNNGSSPRMSIRSPVHNTDFFVSVGTNLVGLVARNHSNNSTLKPMILNSSLNVQGNGNVLVQSGNLWVTSGNTDLDGDLDVEGDLDANGDVDVNGDITVNNNALIRIQRFTPNTDADFNTGVSTADWNATIAGFDTGAGDIEEDGSGNVIMQCYMFKSGGTWWITKDFNSHFIHEQWPIVDVMFIRTEISQTIGF